MFGSLASSQDGRHGRVLGIQVEVDRQTETSIRIRPGARLEVRYRGAEPWMDIVVLLDDEAVGFEAVKAGESTPVIVPPGILTVVLTGNGGAELRREIEVVEGETAELIFSDH